MKKAVGYSTSANLLVLCGVAILLHLDTDRWWLATALAFVPRWIWAVPLAVTLPLAIWQRRRAQWMVLGLSLVVLLAMTGVPAPAGMLSLCQTGALEVRLLTCNADSGALDVDAMGKLIREVAPDVVLFQAIPRRDLAALFAASEWDFRAGGGLAIASRFPIRSLEQIADSDVFGKLGEVARYQIETSAGVITVVNLHLATPRHALEAVMTGSPTAPAELQANSDMRWQQSAQVAAWISATAGPVLAAGD